MTHTIYSHQQLQHKSIARLKQIYSDIGCTVEVTDRRCKDTWINAIIAHQSAQLQRVHEQTTAQAELNDHINAQAQAPEELTTVEISSYHHEYYALDNLFATITHDDNDFVTQHWVVMVNNKEVFRAATPMLCHRYICIHYKDGSLPVQEQDVTDTLCTTENEIMVQIFNSCQKYGLELLDNGIYLNDVRLGEVGCTDGHWWVTGKSQKRIKCDSAPDAVWWLSMGESALTTEPADCEELLDLPFEQLTVLDWERLRKYEPVTA